MQISKNKVVSLSYILKQDNAHGALIEQTQDSSPLVFIYGVGQMLPRFEENLLNRTIGDNFEFTLASAEAYGEHDPNAIIDLDKEIFKIDGVINESMLETGNIIPMRDDMGNMLQGIIESVTEDKVRMNFNHPMSGKTLYFTGKVLDVREATEEDLSYGSCASGCNTSSCDTGGCGCGCGC